MDAFRGKEMPECQAGAGAHGQHAGPGRARHFPVQGAHEQQVQADVGQAADDQVLEGPAALAHPLQGALEQVVGQKRYRAH